MAIEVTPDRAGVLFVYSNDSAVTVEKKVLERYGVGEGDPGCLVLFEDAKKSGDPTLFELRPLTTADVLAVQKLSDQGHDRGALKRSLEKGLISIDGEPYDKEQDLVFYVETAINQAVIDLSLGKLSGN